MEDARPEVGLTEEERAVLSSLAEAWNGFLALGLNHPNDLDEFRRSIHSCQCLLAYRVARRVEPYVWPTINPPDIPLP